MDRSTSSDGAGEMSSPLRRSETLSAKATALYNPTRKLASTKSLRVRRPALQVAQLSIDFATGQVAHVAQYLAAKSSQPPLYGGGLRSFGVAA